MKDEIVFWKCGKCYGTGKIIAGDRVEECSKCDGSGNAELLKSKVKSMNSLVEIMARAINETPEHLPPQITGQKKIFACASSALVALCKEIGCSVEVLEGLRSGENVIIKREYDGHVLSEHSNIIYSARHVPLYEVRLNTKSRS